MTLLSHPMILPLLSLHNNFAMSTNLILMTLIYDTPIEIGLIAAEYQ